MPLAGGKTLPVMSNPTLPATMYSVASGGSQLTRRDFNGAASSVAPTPVTATTNAPAWGSHRRSLHVQRHAVHRGEQRQR